MVQTAEGGEELRGFVLVQSRFRLTLPNCTPAVELVIGQHEYSDVTLG